MSANGPAPLRYKSKAKPLRDIPGRCGYLVAEPNKKKAPCGGQATHRMLLLNSEQKAVRGPWLCKEHARLFTASSRLVPSDLVEAGNGTPCMVWKCVRKATHWDEAGYAICNSCGGN